MKKLIILVMIISTSYFSLAQDLEPTQHKFYIDGDSTFISADSSKFLQNKILIGWQWCQGRSMSKSLLMSQAHCSNPAYYGPGDSTYGDVDTTDFADSVDLVLNIPVISEHFGYSPLHSTSFKYEPTLQIINPGSFTIKQNDNSNAVFGFRNILGNTTSDPARLTLKSSDTSIINHTVLSEPWICNNPIPFSV
jgi:hypothetical protein